MRRRRHGQSMVEMAMVLPFLVLITMGTIEMGYYIYTYSALENAARRASEFASKTPPLSAGNPNNPGDKCMLLAEQEAIEDAFLTQLNGSHISFDFINGGRKVGGQVQATVDYKASFLTPIGSRFFGDTLNFQFTSRRTIVSLSPPFGYKSGCAL